MSSFTAEGDILGLFVPDKGETVHVAIAGTYDQVIDLQIELGSYGSGAWQHVKRFNTENATESFDYITRSIDENLRLFLRTDDGGDATVTLTETSDRTIRTFKDAIGNTLVEFKQSGMRMVRSNNVTVNPWEFINTMTGAGTKGGRGLFQLNVEAALGNWSNALKAYVVYGAAGRTVGLGSALCAEIKLSAYTGTGHYAPLESEIVVSSSGSIGQGTSFLYMNVVDDGTTFRDAGLLFELGDGITAGTGGLFQTSAGVVTSTHSLKIMIAGSAYYIPLGNQTFS